MADGTLVFNQRSVAPTGMSVGQTTIYSKENGSLYLITNDGTEKVINGVASINGDPYKLLWIAGWKPTSASGCFASTTISTGSYYACEDALPFSGSAISYAYANITFPQDFDVSKSHLYFNAHYTSASATSASACGVAFSMKSLGVGDGETLDVNFGASTSACVVNVGSTMTYGEYISPTSASLAISGSVSVGNRWKFLLYRDASSMEDSLDTNALLIGTSVWYPVR